jgi:hypothetical protein
VIGFSGQVLVDRNFVYHICGSVFQGLSAPPNPGCRLWRYRGRGFVSVFGFGSVTKQLLPWVKPVIGFGRFGGRPVISMSSAFSKKRSRIAVVAGRSPMSLPQSWRGRLLVVMVLRNLWRRMMISKRYSPLRFGSLHPHVENEQIGSQIFSHGALVPVEASSCNRSQTASKMLR